MLLLIKNALVYDGSGKPGFRSDILLKNKRIAGVGNFSHRSADKVIDVLGAVVTPGFIDVNTDSDRYLGLFLDPYQADFIRQGVTTIIGGNCGTSLAPIAGNSFDFIRRWLDLEPVNADWHSVAEFLEVLGKRKLGVNFGTLVGHFTIRQSFDDGKPRELTDKETRMFQKMLVEAFREGAFGLSAGLGHVHSRHVSYGEMRLLIETAAKLNKIYSVHLRNETDGLLSAVNEALSIAKDTGVSVEISHLCPLVGYKENYDGALAVIEENSATANVNFDLYPFDTRFVPIHDFLPKEIRGSKAEFMEDRFFSSEMKQRLSEELPNFRGEDLIIAKAPPDYRFLVGKSVKDFAETRNLKFKEALLALMELSRFKMVLQARDVNFESALKFLSHPRSFVSSNGAASSGDSFKPERYYNTFPRFLQLAKERNLMTLEAAVAKMTFLPAKKYGIKGRGLIAEGYFADLVVLRDGQPSEAIVNGEIAMEGGVVKNVLKGQILKAA